MLESGAAKVEEIQRDLACPACQYNLRGLRGAIVSCPECGQVCDVAQLITVGWKGPYFTAPGYSRLLTPVVVLILPTPIFLAILGAALPHSWNVLAMWTVGPAPWLISLWGAFRAFHGWQGVRLSLLVHAIVAGQLVLILSVSVWLVWVVAGEWSGVWWLVAGLIVGLCLLGLMGGYLVIAKRVDRNLGRLCIENYLKVKVTS